MEETIKTFGIQGPLLVASIINFFILFFLMKKYLFKPILGVLDERKATIAKSLEDAKQIEEDKKRMEERVKASLRLANEQAVRTMQQAKEAAARIKEDITKEAQAQGEQLIQRARMEIAQEKEEASKTIRQQSARLITQSVERILAKTDSKEVDEKLIEEALEKVNE